MAPPYGSRSSAHFHVIHIASAAHSPSVDLGVVADAALRRPEHARVLDAVAGEDDAAAVVEPHRAADDERALRVAQPLGDVRVDVGVRDGLVELGDRRPVQRRVPLERGVDRASSMLAMARRSLPACDPLFHAGAGIRTQMSLRDSRF